MVLGRRRIDEQKGQRGAHTHRPGDDARCPAGGVRGELSRLPRTPPSPESRVRIAALPGGTVYFRRALPIVHWISTYAKVRWRLGLRPTYAHRAQSVI